MAAVPSQHLRALKVAVVLSAVGLVGKWSAYVLTDSVAIFSDALESLIHIAAIGVAWYGMQVSFRPPDVEHPFGHSKAAYFSAGLEGGLIILAAVLIGVSAVDKLISGVALRRLDVGLGMTGLVAVLNAVLGRWLLREDGVCTHPFCMPMASTF
jgi:cation diffusion facilitator family transporter